MPSIICAYDTVKCVHIQDARLGLLRYTLLVLVCLYVVVFEMWAMGGYLSSSSVVGVVRFSLQQPTVHNCDPSESGCRNAMAPLDTLPYCTQSTNTSSSYNGTKYKCEIYESINAQIVSETSLVVITRASTTNQTLVCRDDEMTCPRTYQDVSGEDDKFYTAQSEAFTVLLDHAVSATKICTFHHHHGQGHAYPCSAQASNYQGRLLSKRAEHCQQEHAVSGNAFASYHGTKETDSAPCYIPPNQTSTGQDFFSLGTLLKAAGVDLDDCKEPPRMMESGSSSSAAASCQRTYRDSGATVLLNIYWSDFKVYEGRVEPYYYYTAQLVVGSSFKQMIPYYDHYRQSRTLLNAHGIKLAVLLGGEFHQFDMLAFLVTLTTGLGLLAVVTCIVDNLMLYVLPEKKRYQEAKYEVTREFETGNLSSTVAGLANVLAIRNDPHNNNNANTEDDFHDEMVEEAKSNLEEPLLRTG